MCTYTYRYISVVHIIIQLFKEILFDKSSNNYYVIIYYNVFYYFMYSLNVSEDSKIYLDIQ